MNVGKVCAHTHNSTLLYFTIANLMSVLLMYRAFSSLYYPLTFTAYFSKITFTSTNVVSHK